MKEYDVDIREVEPVEDGCRTYHVTVAINPHEFKFLPEVRDLIAGKRYLMQEMKPGGVFRVITWPMPQH